MLWLSFLLFALAAEPHPPVDCPAQDSLDAFWAEAERTVREGDFDAYAALYHDDAVLVNDIASTTQPIADALAGWNAGFDATRAGHRTAAVDFRFTERLHGDATAHETGIFRYTATEDGETTTAYVHFEALVVCTADGWRWLMERQVARATPAEWKAAG